MPARSQTNISFHFINIRTTSDLSGVRGQRHSNSRTNSTINKDLNITCRCFHTRIYSDEAPPSAWDGLAYRRHSKFRKWNLHDQHGRNVSGGGAVGKSKDLPRT
jgi:hypothetical protein